MAAATPLYQIRLAVRRELEDLAAGDTVIVAASGGADSLALAAALLPECKSLALRAIALIVDHGLQSNSADVAHEAKKELVKLGYENVEIRKIKVEVTDGLEASARRARYAAINDVAKLHNATAVFLGHTKDDQAETVLMRLTRGSGAKSLSGMAQVSGKYLRPFLHLRKKFVHDSLDLIGLKAWQDPANTDSQFLRVKVRHELMPKIVEVLGESAISSLDKTSQLLRVDNQALEDLAQKFFESQKDVKINGLEISELEKLPEAIRTRVKRNRRLGNCMIKS